MTKVDSISLVLILGIGSSLFPESASADPTQVKVLVVYTDAGAALVQSHPDFGYANNNPATIASMVLQDLNDKIMKENNYDDNVEFVLAQNNIPGAEGGVIASGFLYDENDQSSPPYSPPQDGQPYDPQALGDNSKSKSSLLEVAHDLDASQGGIDRWNGMTLDELRYTSGADLVVVFGDTGIGQIGGAAASGANAGDPGKYVAVVHAGALSPVPAESGPNPEMVNYGAFILAHEIGHLAKLMHENGRQWMSNGVLVGSIMTVGYSCGFPVAQNTGCNIVTQEFSTESKDWLGNPHNTLEALGEYWENSPDPNGGAGGGGGGGGGAGLTAPFVTPDLVAAGYIGGFPAGAYEIDWSPVSGATYYQVRVNNESDTFPYPSAYIEVIFYALTWLNVYVTACNASECGPPGFAIIVPPGTGWPE